MKTFRLLIVALLICSTASAQRQHNRHKKGDYEPTVYMIVTEQTAPASAMQGGWNAGDSPSMAMQNATQAYTDTHRQGFQQSAKPQFIFTTKNNKFSFAVGGYINMRVAYGFDGIVNNMDMVPYDIPIPGGYANRQKIEFDATTSRVYMKGIVNSDKLGRVVIFVESDFRGGAANSYTPRLRMAYVSFKGFTFGRDVTTFCDLGAAPITVDFQGPNAYNFNFNTMIRYERSFWRDHMTFGVAAEMPDASGTYGTVFAPIPQRVPDFPVYLQWNFGFSRDGQKTSHLRASAVFRNMYAYNVDTSTTKSLFGWGVQASGNLQFTKMLNLYFNGIYGEGITPYIQDLTGSGLDFTPSSVTNTDLKVIPMYAWQAALQINVTRKMWVSGGFSEVTVCRKDGSFTDNQYRRGQYIFGNVFYKIAPRCTIAGEYLFGLRKNMDSAKNHSNRVNVMVQYNF